MDWVNTAQRQSLTDDVWQQEGATEDARVLASVVDQVTAINDALRGAAAMLCPHVAEAGRPALQHLERHTQSLADLLTNLHELQRLKTGKDAVRLEHVSMSQLCERTRVLATKLVGDKQITVTSSVAPGAEWVVSDRAKLERILANLASNAASYTVRGVVEIGATCADGVVRLSVHDTGIGVPVSEQERIFTAFYQGTDVDAGMGLGLAVAQHLARLLGTHIAVKSGAGEGATFFFELPAAFGWHARQRHKAGST